MARRSDHHESGGGGPLIHSGGHRESPVGFGRQTLTRTKDTGETPPERAEWTPLLHHDLGHDPGMRKRNGSIRPNQPALLILITEGSGQRGPSAGRCPRSPGEQARPSLLSAKEMIMTRSPERHRCSDRKDPDPEVSPPVTLSGRDNSSSGRLRLFYPQLAFC